MIDPQITYPHGMAAVWSARLADGPLTADEEAALQAWLDADPAHGEALEDVAATWEAVDRYAAHPRMMAARESALADARRGYRGRPANRRLPWAAAIAATLLLAVTGGGFAWFKLAPQTYNTGVGELRTVTLRDDSRVTLDAATTVRVAYSGATRRLWLEKGRAKFDVAKDPSRPFSVEAGGKVVVATGTAFSVERLQRQVRVVLYEGRIAVLERASDDGDRLLPVESGHRFGEPVIKVGETMILPETGSPRRSPTVVLADLGGSRSWETGELAFDNEPLGAALERVNRYAKKPLRVADPALNDVRISGIFRAGDSAAFAQGLQFAFGIRPTVRADEITLSRD